MVAMRRLATRILLAGVVALVASSCASAPLTPSGRGPAPRVALAGKCWPLPAAAKFHFTYQTLASYRSTAGRSLVVIQWDRIPADTLVDRLTRSLERAHFKALPQQGPWHRFNRHGYGTVGFAVSALPGVSPSALVQGAFTLDLPPNKLGRAGCPYIPPIGHSIVEPSAMPAAAA